MLTTLSLAMTVLSLLLLVPTLVFVAEVATGCFLTLPGSKILTPRDRRIAVLIPARNGGAGIQAAIEDITEHLRPGDRSVVVADNRSDDTATIAASLGAEVSTRS